MRPPTPSTSSVTPIRSGATSWTLRAKKLRLSMRLRGVVAEERRKREREQRAADDAGGAARHDREAQARRVRERAGLEVAERRRSCHLHELDAGDAAEHVARRDSVQHHGTQDGTDLIAETREPETQQRDPELLREPERADGRAPERRRDDDAKALPPDVS